MQLKYAMIGVAGYVAPRHLRAIRETGGVLVAACDKSDSVGVLDQYFPDAAFFTEFERFDRHLEKLRAVGQGIDFFVVCSPNYLHDPHIRFGLRSGAHVICEKPLVLNPDNAELLWSLSEQTNKQVWCILQLRLSPVVGEIKKLLAQQPTGKTPCLELTYITARGKWYYTSWKADVEKSGGVLTNIGVHLFDLLLFLFGPVKRSDLHLATHDRAAGLLCFEAVEVRWFLSIAPQTLPEEVQQSGRRALRQITLGNQTLELSEGFEDLHTLSYEAILEHRGFGIDDALPALHLLWKLRQQAENQSNRLNTDDVHPLALLPLSSHPFKNGI